MDMELYKPPLFFPVESVSGWQIVQLLDPPVEIEQLSEANLQIKKLKNRLAKRKRIVVEDEEE